MGDYPYITTTDKLREFLESIKTKGTPKKVDKSYLAALGYTSSNHRRIIPILKFLGFVDPSGIPTERWNKFRGVNSGLVMAEALKEGYSELFEIHPDIQSLNENDLKSFFAEKTGYGDKTLQAAILTFKVLRGFADFNGSTLDAKVTDDDLDVDDSRISKKKKYNGEIPVVNINIQLTIPDTDNVEVYDKFFEAMKKHIFNN